MLLLACGLLWAPAAYGQTTPPTLTPEQEARAIALDKQLICPICPGETLDQSRSTIARQMRDVIRGRIAQGQTDQQILDYFVSVYGESILARPPRSGFGLTAWVVPPVALAVALIAGFFVLRGLRRNAASSEPDRTGGPAPETPAALRPYLQMVDEEMTSGGSEPNGNVPPVRQ
jgi:cytochrome c-type biogenesis protein CcmH